MRRRAAALLLLPLLVTGCGERSEPVGEIVPEYPVRVAGAGDRPTVLTGPARRIVALDAGPAEIAAELGVGGKLVGVPAGLGTGGGRRGRPVTVVRPTGQLDVAAIRRLEPDLLLATTATDPLDLTLAARETGAAVYVQPADSVTDVRRGIVELGFLLGRAPEARRLVATVDGNVEPVERRLQGTPVASVFVDTGFRITIRERSLLGDLVRRAHGRSVAGATPGPEPVPGRRLARLDPDVYVTTDESVTLAGLRADPATRRLRAVREGRFAVLPGRLVNRAGPDVGAALAAVARALHPDAFGR